MVLFVGFLVVDFAVGLAVDFPVGFAVGLAVDLFWRTRGSSFKMNIYTF